MQAYNGMPCMPKKKEQVNMNASRKIVEGMGLKRGDSVILSVNGNPINHASMGEVAYSLWNVHEIANDGVTLEIDTGDIQLVAFIAYSGLFELWETEKRACPSVCHSYKGDIARPLWTLNTDY
jgi:hypothetical protein